MSYTTPTSPATRAGLSIGDVVIVGDGENCRHAFTVGGRATFCRDDGTESPLFEQNGHTQYLNLNDITIIDTETPAQKAGLKVGDAVTLRPGSLGHEGFFEGQVFLKKDDGSTLPLFGDNHGNSLWLMLNDVTKVAKPALTPAQEMDLKVGDEVIVENAHLRGLHGKIFLLRDDASRSPRFRDQFGHEHYVTLTDVKKAPKVPAGPKAGVAWTDAPKGATHYSLDRQYIEAWHKQNDDGTFAFKSGLKFITYEGEYQTEVDMSKMVPVPGVVTKPNLYKLLEALTAAQVIVDEKTAEINAAGFHVVDGKLSKTLPQSQWKEGDIVRCTKRDTGLADLTVGKLYVLTTRDGDELAICDDVGDKMGGCVGRGCFEFVRRP